MPSRRGFLGLSTVLTFGLFENRCMKEAKVESPADISPKKKNKSKLLGQFVSPVGSPVGCNDYWKDEPGVIVDYLPARIVKVLDASRESRRNKKPKTNVLVTFSDCETFRYELANLDKITPGEVKDYYDQLIDGSCNPEPLIKRYRWLYQQYEEMRKRIER